MTLIFAVVAIIGYVFLSLILPRSRHHLPLNNLFRPIKLNRIFVENIRRLFFS